MCLTHHPKITRYRSVGSNSHISDHVILFLDKSLFYVVQLVTVISVQWFYKDQNASRLSIITLAESTELILHCG